MQETDLDLLAAVSGGAMTNAEMSSLVKSRLTSDFGSRGYVQLAGKQRFAANKGGTMSGRGKFSITNDDARSVEMRSWTADINQHSVDHLHTRHLWISD